MCTKYIVVALLIVGTVSSHLNGRIVNGTDSNILTHPYIASLRYYNNHHCGCTIIKPRWILTAAHCVAEVKPEHLSIQYGLTDVSSMGANIIPIKRIIVHPEFASMDIAVPNDIALIELVGKMIYNYRTIAPVILPPAYFEFDQNSAEVSGVVAGWGLNATGGVQMKTLQEVNLKIYTDSECRSYHGNYIRRDQLCAGTDKGGKGSCNTDSGGPLLHKGNIQVGIVSWGPKPCGSGLSAYTKVSHFIDWIHNQTS